MLVGMREVFCFMNTINKKISHKRHKSRNNQLYVEENAIAHFLILSELSHPRNKRWTK